VADLGASVVLSSNSETANIDSQNAPNPENSTPPKVFPLRSSMMPAISWVRPPNISATPKTNRASPR